jgi:hypothetical protein
MNTYEKWMDFSTRLIGIMDVTDERRAKIMNEVTDFIDKFKDEEIHGWDTYAEYKFYDKCDIGEISDDTNYFGAYRLDSMYEPRWNSFYNQINTVTRAGLDVATEEFGGGVIGYTVGDLQTMYDDEIPEWAKNAAGIIGTEDRNCGVWL